MFKAVTLLLLVTVLHSSSARPQNEAANPPIPIVSQTSSLDGAGNFNYAFETGDGVKEEAKGSLKSIKVPKINPETGGIDGEEDGQG